MTPNQMPLMKLPARTMDTAPTGVGYARQPCPRRRWKPFVALRRFRLRAQRAERRTRPPSSG